MASPRAFEPIGKYLEDWRVGENLLTPGRTIMNSDLDWYNKWVGLEQSSSMRAPHLMLAAIGLIQRLGVMEGTGYMNLGSRWRFLKDVKADDTIWVRLRCSSKRASQSIPRCGIVGFEVVIENQRDELVAEAGWSSMVLRKVASRDPED